MRDNYGLPHPPKFEREPKIITKRRNYLKKLSVQDRNLLLTGDPYFQFDPIVYDCCFWLPKTAVPQLLLNQFNYVIPDDIVASDSDTSSSEPTSSSETESELVTESESDFENEAEDADYLLPDTDGFYGSDTEPSSDSLPDTTVTEAPPVNNPDDIVHNNAADTSDCSSATCSQPPSPLEPSARCRTRSGKIYRSPPAPS